jgi:hypothetical protein
MFVPVKGEKITSLTERTVIVHSLFDMSLQNEEAAAVLLHLAADDSYVHNAWRPGKLGC